MAKIFTKCAVKGLPIDTGIEIEETSFARLPTFFGKIFCPHCGTEHEWSKATACLVEDARPGL